MKRSTSPSELTGPSNKIARVVTREEANLVAARHIQHREFVEIFREGRVEMIFTNNPYINVDYSSRRAIVHVHLGQPDPLWHPPLWQFQNRTFYPSWHPPMGPYSYLPPTLRALARGQFLRVLGFSLRHGRSDLYGRIFDGERLRELTTDAHTTGQFDSLVSYMLMLAGESP